MELVGGAMTYDGNGVAEEELKKVQEQLQLKKHTMEGFVENVTSQHGITEVGCLESTSLDEEECQAWVGASLEGLATGRREEDREESQRQ
jgi:hypothetical protein